MKYTFLLLLMMSMLEAKSQKISKVANDEFANQFFLYWKYGNGFLRARVNVFMMRKGYGPSDIPIVIETMKSSPQSRELMLEMIAESGYDYDQIYNQLYSLQISAIAAKQLTDYIFLKFKTSSEKPIPKPTKAASSKMEFVDKMQTWKIEIVVKDSTAILTTYYGVNHENYDPGYKPVNRRDCILKKSEFFSKEDKSKVAYLKDKKLFEIDGENVLREYWLVE